MSLRSLAPSGNMPPILLIFDIDGTLTDNAGLTRVALDRAALELYGVEKATRDIRSYGLTDPIIFRRMVANNQLKLENTEAEFNRFCRRYVALLEELLASSPSVTTYPGVKELLAHLSLRDEFYLTLGTGNISTSAHVKLQRHGIDHYFPVGGYGDDSEKREEIIRIAYEKACVHYHQDFPVNWAWVIGDTPFDIAAGRALGSRTLAVATGFYTLEQLREHQPTAAVADLKNTEFILRLLACAPGEEEAVQDGADVIQSQNVSGGLFDDL